MIVYIDTTDKNTIYVKLKKNSQVIDGIEDKNRFGSQVLLFSIVKLLKRNKLVFADLEGIEIERGPGSFTGIKVGASVANALGFSLGIPVNGKKIETDLQY